MRKHTLHCFCQSVEIFQIMPRSSQTTRPTYIVEDINDDQDAHTQVNLEEESLLQCLARLRPSESASGSSGLTLESARISPFSLVSSWWSCADIAVVFLVLGYKLDLNRRGSSSTEQRR